MNFIVFDVNGTILRTGDCPENMVALQAGEGESVIAGTADDETQYVQVSTGTVMDKAPLTAVLSGAQLMANGTDTLVLSNLPQPCTIYLEQSVYQVPDGTFEFSVDLPGDYTLRVEALHYLPYETMVTAV